MHRRNLFALFAIILLSPPLFAGSESKTPVTIQLTAAQITELLSGNSVIGTWGGKGYKQYFAKGGHTVYHPDGGHADQGKWRTNSKTNQYESWWQMSNWSSYTIVMTNEGYAWVNGTKLEHFQVFDGKYTAW